MYFRSVRILLGCLGALLILIPAASAGAKLTIGVSDSGFGMFSDPQFTRLHVPIARLSVPWNTAVLRNRSWVHYTDDWLQSAKADHVTPLVSFGGTTNIPSTAAYTAAIKAFLHRFPTVHTYTPWNEPDWNYRPRLSRNPRLAASYFNALVRYCHHCTIAAGDVYLPAPQLGPWIKAYKKGLHYRPSAWAIHPYHDVRGHSMAQINTLAKLTSGQIWLTEISGVERRGHWAFPNQSVTAANNDERFLFHLPKRNHRIARIYHYEWRASATAYWDSALIGPGGAPRPAYWTFANALQGKLP